MITELKNKYNTGDQLNFLLFWGHQPTKDGTISASCFSQWWESDFTVDGNIFKTAEHWMMYQKAILFNDDTIALKVLAEKSPHEAKKLGRKVKNFDPVMWNKYKFEIVVNGNKHKFSQNDALLTYLKSTKNQILVEASPYDKIWGIGMTADNKDAKNPNLWKGENLLGFALMEVRDSIG